MQALQLISLNEKVTDNKWISVGISLTVLCIAVTVAIGIVCLARKGNIKGKGNVIFILSQILTPF